MAEDVPMVQMAKPDVFDPSAMFTQLLAEAQAEMVNPTKSKTGQKLSLIHISEPTRP